MTKDILQKILEDLLEIYLGYDDETINKLLETPDLIIKQRVQKINNLEVWIYSNDHNPPHFHVKTNDLKIDAKFSIESGELIGGDISTKDRKKIMAFYNSVKGKAVMQMIWDRRV